MIDTTVRAPIPTTPRSVAESAVLISTGSSTGAAPRSGPSDLYSKASIHVLDADNWRLKNLSVTYHVPASVCQKFYVKNARIMLGMENVFTLAKNRDVKWMLGGYSKPNYLCNVNLNF